MSDSGFLTRVVVQDYKSIASCDIAPSQFSILVGPTGSGKSNFLSALRLVAESLRDTLKDALSRQGGADSVIRRTEDIESFGIRVDCDLAEASASYAFTAQPLEAGEFKVLREACVVKPNNDEFSEAHYSIERGSVNRCSVPHQPPASESRLYLSSAADMQEFFPLHQALSGMAVYNFSPDAIRRPAPIRPSTMLIRDGSNLAGVLAFLEKRFPELKKLVEEYFCGVISGFDRVRQVPAGPNQILEFWQQADGQGHAKRFHASEMSDGSLRLLGILVALFQRIDRVGGDPVPRLVGIEEPENAMDPAMLEFLVDVFMHAAENTQVLVTTHNTELLAHKEITDTSIITVGSEQGQTRVAPISDVDRSLMLDRTCSAGELLSMNQLRCEVSGPEQGRSRSPLFDFLP